MSQNPISGHNELKKLTFLLLHFSLLFLHGAVLEFERDEVDVLSIVDGLEQSCTCGDGVLTE